VQQVPIKKIVAAKEARHTVDWSQNAGSSSALSAKLQFLQI